jgi:hypothetical protein
MLNKFNNALIRETPGKVLGFLGLSLFTMAMLFTVSTTEASFAGTQKPIPEPFSTAKVMAVVDKTAASYSSFITVNFLSPVVADYKMYGENLSFAFRESGLAYSLGVENLLYGESIATEGQVAGASIVNSEYRQSGSGIDRLYSMLVGE